MLMSFIVFCLFFIYLLLTTNRELFVFTVRVSMIGIFFILYVLSILNIEILIRLHTVRQCESEFKFMGIFVVITVAWSALLASKETHPHFIYFLL